MRQGSSETAPEPSAKDASRIKELQAQIDQVPLLERAGYIANILDEIATVRTTRQSVKINKWIDHGKLSFFLRSFGKTEMQAFIDDLAQSAEYPAGKKLFDEIHSYLTGVLSRSYGGGLLVEGGRKHIAEALFTKAGVLRAHDAQLALSRHEPVRLAFLGNSTVLQAAQPKFDEVLQETNAVEIRNADTAKALMTALQESLKDLNPMLDMQGRNRLEEIALAYDFIADKVGYEALARSAIPLIATGMACQLMNQVRPDILTTLIRR